jgi:hypothetical protein
MGTSAVAVYGDSENVDYHKRKENLSKEIARVRAKEPYVMPVEEYNHREDRRYELAMDEWKAGDRSVMPQIAFYHFHNDKTGAVKRRGFVVDYGYGQRLFKTKKEAEEYKMRRMSGEKL